MPAASERADAVNGDEPVAPKQDGPGIAEGRCEPLRGLGRGHELPRAVERDAVPERHRVLAGRCPAPGMEAHGNGGLRMRVDDAADVRARAIDLAVERQLVGEPRAGGRMTAVETYFGPKVT